MSTECSQYQGPKHRQLDPEHLICVCGDPDCDWKEAAEAAARRDWCELTEIDA